MTQMLRRGALMMAVSLPLLAGCASDGCEQLVYEDNVPKQRAPLVIPEGVKAPPESGDFRVPAGDSAAPTGRCMARPPLILPEEVVAPPADEA